MRRRSDDPEDLSDEEQLVAEHKATGALERQKELDELRELLANEKLRDFLWRILEHSQMFAEGFHANFGVTAHNLGRAAMGKWLLNEIVEADYNGWLLMQQRHYQQELERSVIEASGAVRPPA